MPDAGVDDELAQAVASVYDLGQPVSCRRLRGGFNEHYRLSSAAGEHHLRLYLEGKYYISGDDDLRFELALLDHLGGAGVPVAAPVRRADGGLLSVADLGGVTRRFAVFDLAPGQPPSDAPSPRMAAALGSAVGRIHAEADAARKSLPGDRYHLDERYLLHEPLRLLRQTLGEDTSALDERAGIWDDLEAELADLDRSSPRYGIIHADLHPGNLHVDGDRFTLFDFDHCAHGWRAYDLAICRMVLPDPAWSALLDGYDSVRPLEEDEVRSVSLFTRLRLLWDIGDMLAMEPVWGTTKVTDSVPDQLPRILERVDGL